MNEKIHEPVYHAAMDTAQAELLEISETMNRLRARQEKIYAASEALKLVVGTPELVGNRRQAPAAKPVYTMNQQGAPMPELERVQALA